MDDRRSSLALQAATHGQLPPAMVQQVHGVQTHHGNISLAGGNITNFQTNYYGQPEPTMNSIAEVLRLIPNLRKIHLDVLAKVTPGTAVWILKTQYFSLWLDPNGNLKILWGSGIPGAGKSVMASVVINDLEARAAGSGGKICVAYVYFRYSDAVGLTVRDILQILVKQTVERHPDCAVLAEQVYARHLKEGTQPTEVELLQLLRRFTEAKSVTFYVLDALDEAPEILQVDVVRAFATLNAKLFITSRPLKAVEAKAPQAETHSFPIFAQDGDLDVHIAREISRRCNLEELLDADLSFKEEVIASVKKGCGGMFLHASLQLDAIGECNSAHDVTETLKQFPSDIKAVYQQTWNRITPKNMPLAKAVLVWVLNAARSMTIEELRHAIATHPDTHKFEAKRLVPASTLVTLCCGLITVEEETKLVRLVHYTAKEPLQELLCESFPHPHSLLAAVCMTHLTDCGFQDTTISSEKEYIAALQGDPLLAYASHAWATHARKSLDVVESHVRTASFISGCKALPSFTDPDRTAFFDILSTLHIVALYGLPLNLLAHIGMGNPNLRTRIEQASPLFLASWCGNDIMVEDLLSMEEIQVNLVDKDKFSALMLAARKGHESVVKLLLAHPDIQVNLVDNEGWSALMKAAGHGHESVVKLLAHSGIQVNLVDNKGWSALMNATNQGHDSVVKLLLAHPGIQVSLADNEGWSVLMLAAGHGHDSVVKLLLAHSDIQVNLVDSKGWSALMNAANNGHNSVVKLLLAHSGIQVNLVDSKGWSALMKAVGHGHESIVRFLLAYSGIQVNLVDNKGYSALMNAAHFGYVGITELLLAHPDIQANFTSVMGNTALTLAQQQGHEAIAHLLSPRRKPPVAFSRSVSRAFKDKILNPLRKTLNSKETQEGSGR